MMRIKVVTSINVRSSPFTSPRDAIQDAFPEPKRGDAIVEKKNSLATPSLVPGQFSRMDRFIASQRIPRGSRLSGWLHGSSVRRNDGRKPPVQTKKPKTSHTSTYCFAVAEQENRPHLSGIRSYPSTRGVIDPVHSPSYSPTQLTHGSDPRHAAYLERLRAELGSVPREHGNKRRHQQKPKRSPVKKQRLCFPQIKDLKTRQKILGCLFFGTVLTIVLTTCKSTPSCPPTKVCHTILKKKKPPTKPPNNPNKHKPPTRPRPRPLRLTPRPHLPRHLHLLHPHPHHPLLPLPDPPLHAGLRTPDPLRPQQMPVTAPCRRRRRRSGLRAASTADSRRAGSR